MSAHELLDYALAVQALVQALGLYYLDRRVRRLRREFRVYADWPDERDFESIGGTANLHRRKLGWRARLVMRWVGVREWLARKIGP